MNADNVVVLCGRLGADPKAKVFDDGTACSAFSLAVNRLGKDAKCDWLDIEAYGKTAEFVNSYLRKGNLVTVSGEVRVRDWEAQDGTKRRFTTIRADSVQNHTPKAQTEPRDECTERVQAAFAGAQEQAAFDPFGEA